MTTLEVRNATKRYQKDTVVDDVSFFVNDGETVVLFGPSGAGKTVLLRMIAGVVDPDHGKILIDNEDMSHVDAEHRGVGMAFQNFALFPHMSAFDNIASPLTANKQSTSAIQAGVLKVAKLLKIDHVLSHAPKALSNGQKQRTALARALAGSPPLLLLDDPLRNVDAKLRFEMRFELPQLLQAHGATVVYVTQDYKEAMALGDRIAVLGNGRIEQIGTPEDIYIRPATIDIARLFGDPVINLFDVQVQQDAAGYHVYLSDQKLVLPKTFTQIDNASCVLGIRPESIRFASADAADSIPVTIEAHTPLNEKMITLALTKGDREMLISRPASSTSTEAQVQATAPSYRTDQTAHVCIDTNAIMLFDKMTGRSIHTGTHDSNNNTRQRTNAVPGSPEVAA